MAGNRKAKRSGTPKPSSAKPSTGKTAPVSPGVSAAGADISERRPVEHEIANQAKFPSENPNPVLRDSDVKFSNIVKATPMGIFLWQLESDGRLVLVGTNPATDRILGLDCGQFTGKTIEQAFPPLAETELPEIYRTVAATGTPWHSDQFAYEDPQIKGIYEVHAFQTSPGQVAVMFNDISDRKETEASLQAKEADQALILRSVPMVLYSAEVSGEFAATWLSGSVEELTGISGYRFIEGENLWASRLHPDDKERAIKKFKGILETGSFAMEYRLQHADGSYLWFLDQAVLVRDEQGQPKEIIGTWVDISQRKRAEQLLEESEARFRDLYDNAPDMFVSVDVKTARIIQCNQIFVEAMGYTKEEIIGRPVLDMYHPDSREEAKRAFESFATTGEIRGAELQLKRKDGTKIEISLNVTAVRDKQGNVLQSRSVCRDITERRQAEREISRLAKFPSENPNPVLRISSKGNIVYCNEAGQPLLDIWACGQSQRLPTKWLKLVADAVAGQRTCQAELECGQQIFSLTFAPVVDSDYVNVYALEVTSRKRAEERLQFSHRFLEIANRHSEMKPLLKEFVAEVKDFTGYAAVGIRILDDEGNIPYEAYKGFSRKFYKSESFLSVKNDQCMCTKVITGAVDPKLPFYTKGGSFYMNATTQFLSTVPPEQTGQTLNVCNQMGYESVALFPIRLGSRILGLIHVADPRENAFALEVVETLESAAIQLGTAIQRVWAEDALRKSRDELEIRVRQRTSDLARTVEELEAEVRDRIRAEKKLQEEQRRVYSVLQMLPGYVILHGPDHKVRFANDRFLELFGDPGDRPCYEIMRREDQPCDTCQVSSVLEAQTLQEWEWTCRDGRTYHVWGYPFRDVDQTQVMLELGIDITERKNLETEVLRISETERQRIGQDLHDSLSQTLSGISCLTQVLHNKLAAKSLAEAAEAKKIESLITDSVTLTHSLARGLIPVGVEPQGLMNTLKELACEMEGMFNIQCLFHCEKPVLVDDKLLATHLYRIAQEAINNAVRHGQAQNVIISLALSKGEIVLTIKDDGLGLPKDISQSKGLGLRIMNYRASTMGASLSVQPISQGGTCVVCRLKQTLPTESQG